MAPKARVQKRLYYKIGEACKALGIQPYVLRYWETEFPALSPSKSRSGQRVYSEKELEVIRRIKQLLYDEGYTIAGAKKKLEGELAAGVLGEPVGAVGPGSLATAGAAVAAPAASVAKDAPVAQGAPAAARAQAAFPAVDGVRGIGAANGPGREPGPGRGGGAVTDGGVAGGGAAGPLRSMPLPLVPRAPAAASASGAPEDGPAPGLAPMSPASPARMAGTVAEPMTVPAAPAAPQSGETVAAAAGADPSPAVIAVVPGPFGLTALPVPEVREAGAVPTPAAAEATAVPAASPPSDPQESPSMLPLMPSMPVGAASMPAPMALAAPGAARAGSRQVRAARVPDAETAGETANGGGEPAAPGGPLPATARSGGALDSDAAKQIETLRKGIHRALENAREILALLDSSSPQ